MTHCVQGDAFKLPFKKDSFDAVINCQFLNQQKPEDITRFLEECYAVLKPYGRLILIWRNGSALIHKAAHAAYTILDKITNNPSFPVFDHPLPEITRQASSIGFETQTQFVTFPLLNWKSDRLNSFSAKVIGASAVLVLQKNI
jgi:SAM-dependent methyltransferase